MYTVKELFCGYFLFQYEKRGLNPRIVPLMLLDPHMWDTSVYNDMVLSFPYHTVLTSMREPVVTFGRAPKCWHKIEQLTVNLRICVKIQTTIHLNSGRKFL